jgi:hypothetical protein
MAGADAFMPTFVIALVVGVTLCVLLLMLALPVEFKLYP